MPTDRKGMFDDDVEDKMKRIVLKRQATWGNRITTPIVTNSMSRHTDVGRCICETCSEKRTQPPLPPMKGRRPDVIPVSDTSGTPARPREDTPMNTPLTVPAIGSEQIPFMLRLLSGPNRKPAPHKEIPYHGKLFKKA
jgi:hypothetical protein